MPSAPSAEQHPENQSHQQQATDDRQSAIETGDEAVDRLPFLTQLNSDVDQESVPECGGRRDRDQRLGRREIRQSGKGGNKRAKSRQEPADENPGDPEPHVLPLHPHNRGRRQQPAPRAAREKCGAKPPGQTVDRDRPQQVHPDGDSEDCPRINDAVMAQESAQRHDHVAGGRRKEILHERRKGDDGIDR